MDGGTNSFVDPNYPLSLIAGEGALQLDNLTSAPIGAWMRIFSSLKEPRTNRRTNQPADQHINPQMDIRVHREAILPINLYTVLFSKISFN